MNGIYRLLQGGGGCELEQYAMGNKSVNNTACLVVVIVGGLEGAGQQPEWAGVCEFLKLQNVNHVSAAVLRLMYLCVLALKIACREYMIRLLGDKN